MSQANLPYDPNTLREELEDRLADLALSEVLGGQRPPDLSQRVVTASRRSSFSWPKLAAMCLAASVLIAAGVFAWVRGTAKDELALKELQTSYSQITQVSPTPTPASQPDAYSLPTAEVAAEEATTAPLPTSLESRMAAEIRDSTDDRLREWTARSSLRFSEDRKQLNEDKAPLRAAIDQLEADHRELTESTVSSPGNVAVIVTPRIIVQEEEAAFIPPAANPADPARPDSGRGPGQAGDRYSRIVENPFLKAAENPLSTFSIDVDTASYAKARRYLMQNGVLPPPDAVRIEEFINYFHYDYAPPKDGDAKPFASHVEVAACPWQPKHRLVKIGLKGREIQRDARPTSNLVFLLDVSGSMEPDDKLPRVRRSMRMLVEQLGENDRVAIVVYAGATGLALPSTPGYRKDEILTALDNLHAGGSTNGGAGIRLAYDAATAHFIKGGTNRVILCTDGDFNVGTTSTAELERLAEEKAKTGVFLTVLGFGMGNHNDEMLEKLADKGNGNYGYIDTEEEARKLLVEQLSGTLVTIAKDVKIQVEFNPRTVGAYRLLGYENRMLRAEDFNDDKKDAGEIGAGHTVTALYEIVPAGEKIETPPVDPLRYQQVTQPTDATVSGELLTLKLRYKEPDGQESKVPLVFPVSDRGLQFGQASQDFKFAAAVAGFAMLLRDSQHKGNMTYDAVLEIAQEGKGEDRNGYRAAFLEIVKRAKAATGG